MKFLIRNRLIKVKKSRATNIYLSAFRRSKEMSFSMRFYYLVTFLLMPIVNTSARDDAYYGVRLSNVGLIVGIMIVIYPSCTTILNWRS